jgi:membrane protein YdbS with pleckstrin-like domain
VQSVESRAFWIFFFSRGIHYSLLALLMVFWLLPGELFTTLFGNLLLLAVLAVGFIFLISGVWALLYNASYAYDLTDAGFQVRSGVLFKKLTTIPYDRIQNVDVYQGPLLTMFGLRELRIQTAGSVVASKWNQSEGTVTGLSPETTERLRSELLSRSRGTASV